MNNIDFISCGNAKSNINCSIYSDNMEFIKQPIMNSGFFGSSDNSSCSKCNSNQCVINACTKDYQSCEETLDLAKDKSICWGKICRPAHLLPW